MWIGFDEAKGGKEQSWVMGRALGKFWREGVELYIKNLSRLIGKMNSSTKHTLLLIEMPSQNSN
jgi:hypothetical protein